MDRTQINKTRVFIDNVELQNARSMSAGVVDSTRPLQPFIVVDADGLPETPGLYTLKVVLANGGTHEKKCDYRFDDEFQKWTFYPIRPTTAAPDPQP